MEQHSSYYHRGWRGNTLFQDRGENRQDDRKIEGKGKSRRGRARKGPQEKELPQHGYTPGPLAPLLVKRFSDCL